jgi:hypothetical protein
MGATMTGKSSVGVKGLAATVLAGVTAGLMAAPLLSSKTAVGASGTAETAMYLVDRTHKGDRLDAPSPISDARARGRTALRYLMQRSRQGLREACEPPASPYVDPQLAKLPGRCLT